MLLDRSHKSKQFVQNNPNSPDGDSFTKAMVRLVRVPKAEIDAEEAKYRRMQKRRKAKRGTVGKKPHKGDRGGS
jgi:hypothetical protein